MAIARSVIESDIVRCSGNEPRLTVEQVAGRVGFSGSRHLASAFRRLTGLTRRPSRTPLALNPGNSANDARPFEGIVQPISGHFIRGVCRAVLRAHPKERP